MSTFFIILSLICFVLLLIGLIKPKTVKCNSRKRVLLIFGLGTLFCLIIGGALSGGTQQKETIINKDTTQTEVNKHVVVINQDSIDAAKRKEDLEWALKSLEEVFKIENLTDVVAEITILEKWRKLADSALNDGDNAVLAKQLKTKIIATQKKEFPKMRQLYAKTLADKLWEHDVYVTTSGQGNTILNLTAAYFAANKNIKEMQGSLLEMATKLRFTETRYRWYKGADEFTYYKIESLKDTE